MGYKKWAAEPIRTSNLFLAEDLIEEMKEHEILNPESAIEVIKQEITDEYQKATVLNELINKPVSLYK